MHQKPIFTIPTYLAVITLALATTFMGCVSSEAEPSETITIYAIAQSVFVSGEDVYAAGTVTVFKHSPVENAALWKNGVIQYLPQLER